MSRDLFLVTLSLLTWGIGEGMFFNFQSLYLRELGANPLLIGKIFGAVGICMALSHIPAGYLSDRVGRRPLLWAAWFLGLVATWCMALAKSLPIFVAGMLLYGITAFVMAPLSSYVTAARGRLSIRRALSFIGISFSIGAIVGPLLGGWIGDRVGLHQTYLVAACIFILSSIIILFIRPQPIEHAAHHEKRRGLHLDLYYFIFLGIVFLAVFSTYLPQPLTPNYLQSEYSLSYNQIGFLTAMISVGNVVMNLIFGHIDARLGFLVGQGAVAAFALLIWQGSGLPWFTLAYFLVGGHRAARTMATAQTRQLVKESAMGLAYGITEMVNSTGVILASPLAGYIYEQNPAWVYAISLGLIIISIIAGAIFLFARHEIRSTSPTMGDTLPGS